MSPSIRIILQLGWTISPEHQPKVLLQNIQQVLVATEWMSPEKSESQFTKVQLVMCFLTQKCITRAAMGAKGRGRAQQGQAAASAVTRAWRTECRRVLQTPEGSVEVEGWGVCTEWAKVRGKMKEVFCYPAVDPVAGVIAVTCCDRSPPRGLQLKLWLLRSVCECNQSKLDESTGEINKMWPEDFFFCRCHHQSNATVL